MGKKKFIDKKKSATYQLIARDTSDPKYNEGPSGDTILVRVDDNSGSFEGFNEDASNDAPDSDSIFADASDDCDDDDESGTPRRQGKTSMMPNGAPALPDNIRKEILELGFPDDGYNYLAHLRDIKNTGGGSVYYENPKAKLDQMQNDVKAYDASRVEISKVNNHFYEKSIYNVASMTAGARIQKVVDPDVAALLDDSDLSRFGSDVEDMEEDFVVNANLPEDGIDVDLDEEQDSVDGHVANRTESFGSKASDSQKHVTQSYIGKGKNLVQDEGIRDIDEKPRVRRLLDEQFDMLELQEYGSDGSDEYGEFVDDEEYHEPLAEKLNHSIKDHVKDELELEERYKAPSDLLHGDKTENNGETLEGAEVIQKCIEYAEKYENELTDEDVVVLEESSDESEIWDCETIVSTYSNLDNHPGKIGLPELRRKKKLAETFAGALSAPSNVISLKGKQGLPVDFLPGSKKSVIEKVKEDNSLRNEVQKRKPHGQESKEEKKERKAAVKEERRKARCAKKDLKGLYKGVAHHAQKVAAFTGPSSIHLM